MTPMNSIKVGYEMHNFSFQVRIMRKLFVLLLIIDIVCAMDLIPSLEEDDTSEWIDPSDMFRDPYIDKVLYLHIYD